MKRFFQVVLVFLLGISISADEVELDQLKQWFSGTDFVKVSRAARMLENEKYLTVLKKWQKEGNDLLAKRSFAVIKKIVRNDDLYIRTKENMELLRKDYNLQQDKIYKYFDWLLTKQNPDGSWGQGSHQAMTALAILSLNTHGKSLEKRYQKALKKGLKWLIDSPLDLNKWHSYPTAVMACALGDTYKFYEINGLEEKLKKCMEMIINGQQAKGAFNYRYSLSEDRQDFSFSYWQYEALAITRKKNLKVDDLDKAIDKSLKLLNLIVRNNYNFPYSTSLYNFEDKSFRSYLSFRGIYNFISLSKKYKIPAKYMDELEQYDIDLEAKEKNRYAIFSVYFFAFNSFLLSMDSKNAYEKSVAFLETLKQEDGSWLSSFNLSLKDKVDAKIYSSYHAVRILSLPYLLPAK